MHNIKFVFGFVIKNMAMKKLILFAVIITVAVSTALGSNDNLTALQAVSTNGAIVIANDDGDVDLYLDCFQNAVKDKDMELAAKIANVLYSMNMSASQQKRFSAIEDKISKKDYRTYRDNLNKFSSKSTREQNYYNIFGLDNGDSTFDENNDDTYVDDIIDAFYDLFKDFGETDSDNWHYERHDTIDGGGMLDVFVDAFSNFLFDDSDSQEKSAADNSEIDSLLDDYENYIGLSVEALRKVMSGAENALKDFEEYSKKASEISDKLSRADSKMTSEQFKRYMHILGSMVSGIF